MKRKTFYNSLLAICCLLSQQSNATSPQEEKTEKSSVIKPITNLFQDDQDSLSIEFDKKYIYKMVMGSATLVTYDPEYRKKLQDQGANWIMTSSGPVKAE